MIKNNNEQCIFIPHETTTATTPSAETTTSTKNVLSNVRDSYQIQVLQLPQELVVLQLEEEGQITEVQADSCIRLPESLSFRDKLKI